MERFLLHFARNLNYLLVALSGLITIGLGMTFYSDFTIENKTTGHITVTPVGTVGHEGHKALLPVKALFIFPAFQSGDFRLAPGESARIWYDMDDINFSEIVIDDGAGKHYQLVTDPSPTTNQYHGPLQRQIVIDDLSKLEAPLQRFKKRR